MQLKVMMMDVSSTPPDAHLPELMPLPCFALDG